MFMEISQGFLWFVVQISMVYGCLWNITEVFASFRLKFRRFHCLWKITGVFGVFSQDFGAHFVDFSGADASRREIHLRSASLPSRHLPSKICRSRCLWNITEVFGVFSQDCGAGFVDFSGADASRREILLRSASLPSRHLPSQICRSQCLWNITEVFGVFHKISVPISLICLAQMRPAGKFTFVRHRLLRAICLPNSADPGVYGISPRFSACFSMISSPNLHVSGADAFRRGNHLRSAS